MTESARARARAPADILALGPRNILRRPNGDRVLRFARGKTRVVVEIEIVGELAKIIDECLAASVVDPIPVIAILDRREGICRP